MSVLAVGLSHRSTELSTLERVAVPAHEVGKVLHTETGLDQLGASVVSEALAAAGEVTGKHALIVGAGSMGALSASQLRKAGIGEITVANRTDARARRLAASVTEQGVPARAVSLAML